MAPSLFRAAPALRSGAGFGPAGEGRRRQRQPRRSDRRWRAPFAAHPRAGVSRRCSPRPPEGGVPHHVLGPAAPPKEFGIAPIERHGEPIEGGGDRTVGPREPVGGHVARLPRVDVHRSPGDAPLHHLGQNALRQRRLRHAAHHVPIRAETNDPDEISDPTKRNRADHHLACRDRVRGQAQRHPREDDEQGQRRSRGQRVAGPPDLGGLDAGGLPSRTGRTGQGWRRARPVGPWSASMPRTAATRARPARSCCAGSATRSAIGGAARTTRGRCLRRSTTAQWKGSWPTSSPDSSPSPWRCTTRHREGLSRRGSSHPGSFRRQRGSSRRGGPPPPWAVAPASNQRGESPGT